MVVGDAVVVLLLFAVPLLLLAAWCRIEESELRPHGDELGLVEDTGLGSFFNEPLAPSALLLCGGVGSWTGDVVLALMFSGLVVGRNIETSDLSREEESLRPFDLLLVVLVGLSWLCDRKDEKL